MKERELSGVNILAMTDIDNQNYESVCVKGIDDAIFTNAHAIAATLS